MWHLQWGHHRPVRLERTCRTSWDLHLRGFLSVAELKYCCLVFLLSHAGRNLEAAAWFTSKSLHPVRGWSWNIYRENLDGAKLEKQMCCFHQALLHPGDRLHHCLLGSPACESDTPSDFNNSINPTTIHNYYQEQILQTGRIPVKLTDSTSSSLVVEGLEMIGLRRNQNISELLWINQLKQNMD